METKISFNFFQNECLKISANDLMAKLSKNIKTIAFKLDNFENIISYEKQNMYFIRENEEYKFKINFNNKKAFLKLKKYDSIDIDVLDCNFEKQNTNIIISYKLEADDCIINRLEIKLIDETL